MTSTTVTIEVLTNDPPTLLMQWQPQARGQDVHLAFETIQQHLEQSDQPMFVMVDLSQMITMPIPETVRGALNGPYRHDKLREWLVISTNAAARVVEQMLARITRRYNVRWFRNRTEALAYLESCKKS